jgi:hypothetical protein
VSKHDSTSQFSVILPEDPQHLPLDELVKENCTLHVVDLAAVYCPASTPEMKIGSLKPKSDDPSKDSGLYLYAATSHLSQKSNACGASTISQYRQQDGRDWELLRVFLLDLEEPVGSSFPIDAMTCAYRCFSKTACDQTLFFSMNKKVRVCSDGD